ncbi:uncharacterized protein LOC118263655 [Spodoptera frugiperda]|uniref:Uncharacterized protein LOC118263655 n=1 Tax=Spodoptera frugiperda TaxID=7108 RepID=A0A9R0E8H5_SPOFR|nr:uncharacterized protein LOC118263655 [Spodoptera frugiperda]XP_050560281.1 uncharacterized protein LOC118263655 [Spodoptera frugiperda]XP_050560282.1 uncharacterized protein LOC118263655 [Spodoptera frugiperda]XP_050560283.1 uncharacterized protein LOC118263655 [Spodoptera frugiperda]
MFTTTQPPPPLPHMFDPSRPPPPLPTNATPNKNGAVKRSAERSNEAGPSKAKKADCVKVDGHCENCIQRELRAELYRQELQKLEFEYEYQSYIFEKMSAELLNQLNQAPMFTSVSVFHIHTQCHVHRPDKKRRFHRRKWHQNPRNWHQDARNLHQDARNVHQDARNWHPGPNFQYSSDAYSGAWQ